VPYFRQKKLVPRANKEFLQRTLASSLHSSARQASNSKQRKHKPDDDKRSASNNRNKILKLDKNTRSALDSKKSDRSENVKEKHAIHSSDFNTQSTSKSALKASTSATWNFWFCI